MRTERLTATKRFGLLAATGAFALGLSTLAAWRASHVLFINATTSLPDWAFMLDRNASPKRGDMVLFTPPPSALLTTHFGANPAPFGKLVYGVPGDTVRREGRMFRVNGHDVALAKPMSRRGEPLGVGPVGVLPRGCYFLGTPNPDSFDSRYAAIGWICRDRLLGVGTPIL